MAGTSPFRGGFAGSAAKRLPPQRELSCALAHDGGYSFGLVGVSPIGWVKVTAADRAAATCKRWGTNPSARRWRAPPLSGEALQDAPLKGSLRRGSCHARWRMTEDTPTASADARSRRTVAAALSAAVTSTKQQETRTYAQAEPSQRNVSPRTPAALREGAQGGERQP